MIIDFPGLKICSVLYLYILCVIHLKWSLRDIGIETVNFTNKIEIFLECSIF